jgi:hypothetical protein
MGFLAKRPDVGKLREKRDVKRLLSALDHEDADVRKEAASALGETIEPIPLGASSFTVTQLFQMHFAIANLAKINSNVYGNFPDYPVAENEAEEARRLVAVRNAAKPFLKTLRRLADPSVADGLVTALGDADREVRRAAAVSLGQVCRVRTDLRLGISGWHLPELEGLVDTLYAVQEVPALIEAMSDRHEEVRKAAGGALEAVGDERAIPRLSAVAEHDSSAEVRAIAQRAVAKIGERRTFVPDSES